MVPCVEVIDAAKDELSKVTLLSNAVTLPANDDENVVEVLLTSVIFAAREELFTFMELCRPSILVAAEELFVVIVPFTVEIDELRDAEVLTKDESNVVNLNARDELVLVNAESTCVIDAARDALSNDPVPACAADITSILLASDEELFVNAVSIDEIEAANEELFVLIDVLKLSITVAVLELLLVIVVDNEEICELIDEDAA